MSVQTINTGGLSAARTTSFRVHPVVDDVEIEVFDEQSKIKYDSHELYIASSSIRLQSTSSLLSGFVLCSVIYLIVSIVR